MRVTRTNKPPGWATDNLSPHNNKSKDSPATTSVGKCKTTKHLNNDGKKHVKMLMHLTASPHVQQMDHTVQTLVTPFKEHSESIIHFLQQKCLEILNLRKGDLQQLIYYLSLLYIIYVPDIVNIFSKFLL